MDRQRLRGGKPCVDRGSDGKDVSIGQGRLSMASTLQKLGENLETSLTSFGGL